MLFKKFEISLRYSQGFASDIYPATDKCSAQTPWSITWTLL